MSNIREILNKVEKGIKEGYFLTFRLLDKDRNIITTYKRNKDVWVQWNYIKQKLSELPDGVYIIKASADKYNHDTTEYEIIKDTTPEIITPTKSIIEQQNNDLMNEISLDDYLDLVRENEKLKSQVAVLQTQIDLQKQYFESNKETKGLSEPSPLAAAFESIAPAALGLLDKYLSIQEEKNNIEKSKVNKGLLKGRVFRPQKKQPLNESGPTYEQIYNDCKQLQDAGNESALNDLLDNIEALDINTYNRLISDLGIEEIEENENE